MHIAAIPVAAAHMEVQLTFFKQHQFDLTFVLMLGMLQCMVNILANQQRHAALCEREADGNVA